MKSLQLPSLGPGVSDKDTLRFKRALDMSSFKLVLSVVPPGSPFLILLVLTSSSTGIGGKWVFFSKGQVLAGLDTSLVFPFPHSFLRSTPLGSLHCLPIPDPDHLLVETQGNTMFQSLSPPKAFPLLDSCYMNSKR